MAQMKQAVFCFGPGTIGLLRPVVEHYPVGRGTPCFPLDGRSRAIDCQ